MLRSASPAGSSCSSREESSTRRRDALDLYERGNMRECVCSGTRTNIRERGWHVWVSSRRCPLLVRVCSRNFGKAQKHATQTVQHSKTRYTKISLVEQRSHHRQTTTKTTLDPRTAHRKNTTRTYINSHTSYLKPSRLIRAITPTTYLRILCPLYLPHRAPRGRSIPGAILRGPSTPRPQLW